MTDQTPDPEAPGPIACVRIENSQWAPLRLLQLPAFSDNYLWLLADTQGHALAIDPGSADVVEAALAHHRLQLTAIALTHHHPDHTGGVAALCAAREIPVYGPADPRMPVTRPLAGGGSFEFGGRHFEVLDLAGHTRSHIGYFDGERLFCGDTLFALGCGRLFEGTPAQMWAALERIMALPPNTLVCCAHEYTEANLRYARWLFPDDPALIDEQMRVDALRNHDLPTVPSSLAHEMQLNPFLRMRSPRWRQALARLGIEDRPEPAFALIRSLKDSFR